MTKDLLLASRLKDALAKKGFASSTSKMGVQAAPLARHLNISVQMIRKYLSGESYPDIGTIIDASRFLNVNPGWLAFGEHVGTKEKGNLKFEIELEFIEQIISGLFNDILEINLPSNTMQSACAYLYGIINDIAQLDADREMKKRLIKTSLSSANIKGDLSWKPKMIV